MIISLTRTSIVWETGSSYAIPVKKQGDLGRLWNGPYRITACDDMGVSAVKVYFSREDADKVHQTRVKPCPDGLLAGYYWYGNIWKGPGRPPKCVEKILSNTNKEEDNEPQEELEYSMAASLMLFPP